MKVSRRPSLAARARGFAVAAITALMIVLPAQTASAHDELISTDPAIESTIDELPAELTLRFSGELIGDEGTAQVVVTAPDGAELQVGSPVVDGAIVTQALDTTVAVHGTVVVQWRVVSGDGHPISDEFVVGVGEAPTEPSAPASEEEEAADTALTLLAVVIGVVVVGTILTVVVAFIMRRRHGGGSRARGRAE